MSENPEEQLREAACLGDLDGALALLAQHVDVNAQNAVNGWTALHWAANRGHAAVVRALLERGADARLANARGETAGAVCAAPVAELLGEPAGAGRAPGFVPSYMRNPQLNGHVDVGKMRSKHQGAMQTTVLPVLQSDEVVLSVRVAGSGDPDFIEIEIPKWKLTYATLLKQCCDELEVACTQVERIRKLPNTRLRKDADVKRLVDFQALELVLKPPLGNGDKGKNCYQSISSKDQQILY